MVAVGVGVTLGAGAWVGAEVAAGAEVLAGAGATVGPTVCPDPQPAESKTRPAKTIPTCKSVLDFTYIISLKIAMSDG